MKRSIKLVVCLLLVVTIALPSVFATGLGTSSSIVKVGTIDDTDVNYNVDIEWGSLVYNYEKTEDEYGNSYYVWEPEELGADTIVITNKSNVIVNADIKFTSAIPDIIGFMDEFSSSMTSVAYLLLTEEPDDFTTDITGIYYEKDADGEFVAISEGTTFEENKYYVEMGGGAGPIDESGDIPASAEIEGSQSVFSINYTLKLEGGSLSDIRPGATIGAVTVTLS